MTRDARPFIGVTADLSEAPGKLDNYQESTLFVPQRYLSAIEQAGAIALVLPPNGERPIRELGAIKARRTKFELEMTAAALEQDVPILGICGGAQAINVALGGSLYQDIEKQVAGAGAHEQGARKKHGGHQVNVTAGTRLHAIVRRRTMEVNTTHHQAVKKVGRGLVANAVAEDGIIEGIESTQHRWVLGVQWHPEVLAPRRKDQQRIFSLFVAHCARRRRGA